MHDINLIRNNPIAFDEGLHKRGLTSQASGLIALDDQRRELTSKLQLLHARRNAASKEIAQAMNQKDIAKAEALKTEVALIKEDLPAKEQTLENINLHLRNLLMAIPNLPAEDVPIGKDESANEVLRSYPANEQSRHLIGLIPNLFKQHFEVGEEMGLMDFKTAAKLSGSRFVILKGHLARLERALGNFMIDLHTSKHGYTEISPPLLVRTETMYGTAQLPKFRDDQFATARSTSDADEIFDSLIAEGAKKAIAKVNEDIRSGSIPTVALKTLAETFSQQIPEWRERFNTELVEHLKLWLIPTAEVSLTNLVRESTLEEDQLPIRVAAWTPCFRAEAGAAGRDTRGMIRQHQFMKVELVSITKPEESTQEHERMTECAEEVLKQLDLRFRTVKLCTGDMGFSARKTYDIEVWLPGQNAYREISSCSVCGDFQARRMDARYKPKESKGPRFVHTLNGSGVAVGRALIAVLENYQNPDGSVTVPEALRPYMNNETTIKGL